MARPDLKEQSSHLVRGLQIAAVRQSEKTYRGNSRDKAAAVKISGSHEILEIELDPENLDLPDEKLDEISAAILEAANRAIANAQAAARRALDEGLNGRS